ncbi:hypothetical protein V501_04476 [Pseudogymnoascus sp. VKM F-4519 (FW-2642)]|nr:hypothetical protein V501_04476 [Pseudogymnoascus sp. VKM F-4519 (FW-2642)]
MNGEHTRRQSGITDMDHIPQIDPRLADIGQKVESSYPQNPTASSEPLANIVNQADLTSSTTLPPLYHPAGYDASQQPNYSPDTPQLRDFGINNNDDGASDPNQYMAQAGGTPEEGTNDLKRPRACEACRGLKVKCEFDPNNQEGPCRRCTKARRNCVVTQPSRKRQKKTDSRVAELEKKIDALTAVLHATRSDTIPHSVTDTPESLERRPSNPYEQVTNGGYGPQFGMRPEPQNSKPNDWAVPDRQYPRMPDVDRAEPVQIHRPSIDRADSGSTARPQIVVAGQKRKYQDARDSSGQSSAVDTQSASQFPHRMNSYISGRDEGTNSPLSTRPNASNEYADVIDRGVITAESATALFNRYVNDMSPHMPAVVFPPGTTAADIRKSKPTLFLAILSAGASTDHPEVQKVFTKEVMQIYADKIICHGEKTLELVQALLVSTIWYWPPEHFEELKFYQLIHLAAVMAIEINISKKNSSSQAPKSMAGLWKDHLWRRTAFPDASSIEARRTWVSCYFLCCNAAMGLRRSNLIRWTSYMGECVEVLETSPDAAPSDKVLCQWVRSQHIAEEVGTQFSMDDSFASVSITDPKVQYALKGFERDLEHWSSHIPNDIQNPLLKMTEHLVNLYMHEVAMHVDHNVESFNAPFTEEKLRGPDNPDQQASRPLTPTHIAALSTCLTSIDGVFEAFMSLDVDTIRALPVMHFVRIAYAVVVLIKMHFAAATPGSELGKVIDKNNMKVEQYLDGLLDKFKATAADNKSRPGSKFLMVLIMLKTWFHRQTNGKANNMPTEAGGQGKTNIPKHHHQTPEHQQQKTFSPANTPLQLLSEVATGSSAAQTPRLDTRTQYPPMSQRLWAQQASQPLNYPDSNGAHAAQGYNNMGYNIDPALGANEPVEYDPSAGDGFEQTVGMTIAEGQLGQYFSDDAFFGVMMEGLPPISFDDFQWNSGPLDLSNKGGM